MPEVLNLKVELKNDKVQFIGVSENNPSRPIQMDYHPPIGDDDGFTGLELLLMSFAGCSGTAVAFLLRRMKKDVSGLTVSARGTRNETPPAAFREINLIFTLKSRDAESSDMEKALKMAEESYCPVWAMIRNNVIVNAEFKITTV